MAVEEKGGGPGPADFERLYELSLDLMCIADLDAKFLWVSPSFTQVLGYSAEELTGAATFLDFIHPDDVEATRSEVAKLGTGVPTICFVNRYRHKEGHWVWLEWNTAPPVDGRLYATARDISETRERQADLERRTQGLMLAEEMANIGHWHVDLRTNALFWSAEVYRIHGLDPEEFDISVQAAIDCYHPDDRQRVSDAIAKAVEERGGFEFELRLVHADGNVRFVRARGLVQCLGDEPRALFGTFQDVTDQRDLQARLLLSERMGSMGTLAAGVAHEINNPLTYVVANLDMMAETIDESSDHELVRAMASMRSMVEAAQHGALRVRKIVQNLKAFARAKQEERTPVNLGTVLDSATTMAAHELRHRARLVLDYEDDVPLVLADAARLGQVFVNLVVNAVHALEEAHVKQGEVRLRLRADDGFVVAEVTDNGVGISEAAKARIFEPFFTTKPTGVGTGLGLPISQQIVTELGGTIEVESELGVGSTFRVRLPAAQAVSEIASNRRPSSPKVASNRTVLIVDDEDFVRVTAAQALQKSFEVATASSAGEALSKLTADPHQFDFILVDVMMPGFSGVELHRQISERWPELAERVGFMTGGAFTPDTRRYLDDLVEKSPHRLLEKPFDIAALRRFVRKNLQEVGDDIAV